MLLDRHLQRLEASAGHFGYQLSTARARDALGAAVAGADRPLRVRLLVDQLGGIQVEQSPLEQDPLPIRVALAARPIDPLDPFVYHKTTNRAYLERERVPGYAETLMWNPRREITEAITANIVVEMDGRKVTPPVECGLLPGTLRAELLERGELVEGRIPVEQLRTAPRFWLINSVRGWREAVLSGASLNPASDVPADR